MNSGSDVQKTEQAQKADAIGPGRGGNFHRLAPTLPTSCFEGYEPGATWVGTWTFESPTAFGETWPYTFTIIKRSGDRFEAVGTLIHLGMKEIHSTQVGTIGGDRIANSYQSDSGSQASIEGMIAGREIRFKYKGLDGEKKPIFGRGTLTYQGPMEPAPRPAQGRPEKVEPVEGSDRLEPDRLLGSSAGRRATKRRIDGQRHGQDGRLGGAPGPSEGDRLTLRWPSDQPPGQAWFDDLVVSPDRKHYAGSTRVGDAVTGSLRGKGGYRRDAHHNP